MDANTHTFLNNHSEEMVVHMMLKKKALASRICGHFRFVDFIKAGVRGSQPCLEETNKAECKAPTRGLVFYDILEQAERFENRRAPADLLTIKILELTRYQYQQKANRNLHQVTNEMAEAIAIIGVAAAALQFAETGYKIISKCSYLMKRSREYPDYLHRTHSQMQHLIYLAKVTSDNKGAFECIASSQAQCAVSEHTEQQSQSTNVQPEPAVMISIQMETIWKDCAHQAEFIDNILQCIMREIEGRGLIGKWRQLSLHERVYNIEKALGELERSKTTLGLWLGNESLYRVGRMHHDLRNQILHSERTLTRMFEEHQRKTENAVLAMIQQNPANKPQRISTRKKKSEITSETMTHSPVIPVSPNQDRSLHKANPSAMRRKHNNNDESTAILPIITKVVEWSKMLTFAGNAMVVQLGSQDIRSHSFASEDEKNTFLDVYIRLRMTWIFDLVELEFSLRQYPGNPSIRASLRTQIRVEKLPLEEFFMDIYGRHWRKYRLSQSYREKILSQQEQLHLFSVARKLLLETFYAGNAFPNSINATGGTLLHLQTQLYRPGYETLFMSMTEFLISMKIDTEVANDDAGTAQSNLCETLMFYDRHGEISFHTVAAKLRPSWTGVQENRPFIGRILKTLEIFQLFQYWPEAILDTRYNHICDVVLRKSVDDLRKLQQQPNSVQTDKTISPLHFAAAASWPAGVETLISMGYPKFQVDVYEESPLDVAIDVGSIPAVEILLKGDCLALLNPNTRNKNRTLPQAFLKVAESQDPRLHNIIIESLSRHKFLLPTLLPYHDLASQRDADNIEFAKNLYIAGFQDIEAYNNFGYTPLMIACFDENIRMASFLLQHGVDPFKCHEDCSLRAGHFLFSGGIFDWTMKELEFRSAADEKRLLETAFHTSIDTEFRCRCSPDGFTPITFLFQSHGSARLYDLKTNFERNIHRIYCSPNDLKRYWRAFVVCETFNRLGMTHTCVKLDWPIRYFLNSRIRLFPDNRRIEIENEEEELFFELEEIVARFDLFSENRIDDMSRCVDEFFDDLDWDLLPRRIPHLHWYDNDRNPGCLGPGESFSMDYYISSRGEQIKYNYKEIDTEESMLRWLFP